MESQRESEKNSIRSEGNARNFDGIFRNPTGLFIKNLGISKPTRRNSGSLKSRQESKGLQLNSVKLDGTLHEGLGNPENKI